MQLVARRRDRELPGLADPQAHGPPDGADGRERRPAECDRWRLRKRRRGRVASVHRDPPLAQNGRRAGHERQHGEHHHRVEASAPRDHRPGAP